MALAARTIFSLLIILAFVLGPVTYAASIAGTTANAGSPVVVASHTAAGCIGCNDHQLDATPSLCSAYCGSMSLLADAGTSFDPVEGALDEWAISTDAEAIVIPPEPYPPRPLQLT